MVSFFKSFSIMLRLLLMLWFLPLFLSAQTSDFGADYRFAEGVYLSHAALLAGDPDLEWEAIAGEMVQLPEDYRVQIAGYGYNDIRMSADILPYAISLDGQAYFFTSKDDKRNFHEFSGLRVQGALSTIYYDTTFTTRQLMKAYNPVNGLPFRQAFVERDKTVTLKMVMELRSGTRKPLTKATLLELLADDAELIKALKTSTDVTEEMLVRAIKLYDDRHKIQLPIVEKK